MSEEERLAADMDAFNRSDYEALRGFYCSDVRLVIGNGQELAAHRRSSTSSAR